MAFSSVIPLNKVAEVVLSSVLATTNRKDKAQVMGDQLCLLQETFSKPRMYRSLELGGSAED